MNENREGNNLIDVETFKERYKMCLMEDDLLKNTVISMLQAGLTEKEMTDFYTKVCIPSIDTNPYKIAMQQDLVHYNKYLVENMTRILAETIAETLHEVLDELKKENADNNNIATNKEKE